MVDRRQTTNSIASALFVQGTGPNRFKDHLGPWEAAQVQGCRQCLNCATLLRYAVAQRDRTWKEVFALPQAVEIQAGSLKF